MKMWRLAFARTVKELRPHCDRASPALWKSFGRIFLNSEIFKLTPSFLAYLLFFFTFVYYVTLRYITFIYCFCFYFCNLFRNSILSVSTESLKNKKETKVVSPGHISLCLSLPLHLLPCCSLTLSLSFIPLKDDFRKRSRNICFSSVIAHVYLHCEIHSYLFYLLCMRWNSKILIFLVSVESVTDGLTDRRNDGQTDGWTDRPPYRDARTHLKI